MIARLVSVTPDSEKTIAYVARVSNPSNQENPDFEKLIRYCIKHNHVSVFEHAYMTLEINTTLGIAPQILRHRSFTFQQFSQRYADSSILLKDGIEMIHLREQDLKNRQNSSETLPETLIRQFEDRIRIHFENSIKLYQDMLDAKIAKECARFVLPTATPTRLYMTGNVRSWMHYISLRTLDGTQVEHKEIASACKEIFKQQFPTISKALDW